MKNLTVMIVFLAYASMTFANVNENKARAFYFAAKSEFENKNYSNALDAIKQAETLLGQSNALLQSIRVKSLYHQERYVDAEKSLELFFTYSASPELIKEMSPYLIDIEKKVEAEKSAAIAKALAEERKIAQEKEAAKKAALIAEKKLAANQAKMKEAAITGAIPAKMVSPKYPEMAKKTKKEGYVIVQYNIDTSGKPINIEIIEQQPQRMFNREAIRAFKQWRFPANTPLTAQKTRIDFKLP